MNYVSVLLTDGYNSWQHIQVDTLQYQFATLTKEVLVLRCFYEL